MIPNTSAAVWKWAYLWTVLLAMPTLSADWMRPGVPPDVPAGLALTEEDEATAARLLAGLEPSLRQLNSGRVQFATTTPQSSDPATYELLFDYAADRVRQTV